MRYYRLYGSSIILVVIMTATVVVGFGRTFFFRPWSLAQPLPILLIVHGTLLSFWMLLLVVQTVLVISGRQGFHRKLGWAALVLLPALFVTSAFVLLHAVTRVASVAVLNSGMEVVAFDGLHLVLFTLFVALAVSFRARVYIHRPLMLLATANLIPPALGRLYALFLSTHIELSVFCTNAALVLLILVAETGMSRVGRRPALLAAAVLTLLASLATYWTQTSGP